MAKISPSTLSKKPPWPGNMLLVSLTRAFLFRYEINKSPNCEIRDIANVTKISDVKLKPINSLKKIGTKLKENIKEPTDPDNVFFGLILLSFLPLKILPKIRPPTSVNIVTSIEYNR